MPMTRSSWLRIHFMRPLLGAVLALGVLCAPVAEARTDKKPDGLCPTPYFPIPIGLPIEISAGRMVLGAAMEMAKDRRLAAVAAMVKNLEAAEQLRALQRAGATLAQITTATTSATPLGAEPASLVAPTSRPCHPDLSHAPGIAHRPDQSFVARPQFAQAHFVGHEAHVVVGNPIRQQGCEPRW